MNKSLKTITAVAIACVGLAFTGQAKAAASCAHVDELALRLQGQATELMRELQFNYRSCNQYAPLMKEARMVFLKAAHIHDSIHLKDNIRLIRLDLDALAACLHHLEDMIALVDNRGPYRRHPQDLRGIPQGISTRGYGYGWRDTRSYGSARLRRLVNRMQFTLDQLNADMAVLARNARGPRGPVGRGPVAVPGPIGPGPVAGPGFGRPVPAGPSWSRYGRPVDNGGISFGNDKFSIRFRF